MDKTITTITVDKDIHNKLVFLKYGLDKKGMSELLEFLIEYYLENEEKKEKEMEEEEGKRERIRLKTL